MRNPCTPQAAMSQGRVHHVQTTACAFTAVRFDGANVEEVLRAAAVAPPAPPGFGEVHLLSATAHPLMRLFDARTGEACIAGVGDWVITNRGGVLVLPAAWFDALFGADHDAGDGDGRLQELNWLAGRLLEVAASLQPAGVPEEPCPHAGYDTAPQQEVGVLAGAWEEPEQVWPVPDPYAASNLTQVQPPRIGVPATPRLHDVWIDRDGRTWTIVSDEPCGDFWNSLCKGEDGTVVAWGVLSAQAGPMRLAYWTDQPVAA